MFASTKQAAALMILGLTGCAATIEDAGLAHRTSIAIGRDVGSFNIVDQRPDTGGRIDYTVNTKDGSRYQCYMYSATGFQKLMSLGQTPHSDAVCTAMGKPSPVSAQTSKTQPPNCNALLKAAQKC